MRRWIIPLLLLLCTGTAQAADPTPELERRANDIVTYFEGGLREEELFAPSFLAALPAPRMAATRDGLRSQYGAAEGVVSIDAPNNRSAYIVYQFANARVRAQISIEPQSPHRIVGLLFTGAEMAGDSLDEVITAIDGLPGDTSFTVARLDGPNPELIATHNSDAQFAIGSTHKLYILAALIRSINNGERQWNDVVPLTHRSLPSGTLHNWPAGSPMTIHTLAGLMISISDNSATDTLLHLVGRDRVHAMMVEIGHADAGSNDPFLSTLDLFRLKMSPNGDLRDQWLAGDTDARRALLPMLDRVPRESLDVSRLQGAPNLIREIEWFASGRDLANLGAWLFDNADETALELLEINPVAGDVTRRWAYLGYKGGSEPGVLNHSFLGRTQNGETYLVSGSWNDAEAELDETALRAIMIRALSVLVDR